MIPKFDVFTFMPFPVFVTDSEGVVIFKNDSCRRNIKNIRNGARVAKHIKDIGFFPQNDPVSFSEISGEAPFFRFAMNKVACDGSIYFVFFFFPMLQFGNHSEIERFMLDRSNGDIFDFYVDLKNLSENESPGRLFSDMVSFINKYDVELSDKKISVDTAYLLDKLFSSLSGAFKALGVRISSRVDKNIYYNRFCRLNPNDYIFVLTRLLYAVIRASSSKKIFIEAVHVEEDDLISVTMKTDSDRMIISGDICELAPECVFESKLISRYYMLGKNVSITRENDGTVNVSYSVSCENVMATLPISNTYYDKFDMDSAIRKYTQALKTSLKNQ